mmetsp:Transcript_31501/g.53723  ORF Transcript_31501/g.53723 Transcript_31501/m.53723 type:complete len:219 (-) Transcript_31501:186-842(-)|eukprot:CAMPEP_0183725670 /NCGR_PEP_ID=MMETSP0737-20130205/21149_1 /TAXON_ID=385413 /ORGANISM="Thalassiosira miniscula, Strain CCMP1093" /LENGTH=218 /DNA_ID=CAMNT_0025956737 /DNA_START=668 /DNA_END=1324 /DNA_ORIENTATION=+
MTSLLKQIWEYSLSVDPVFDWGHGSLAKLFGQTTEENVSRYDHNTMNRIVDDDSRADSSTSDSIDEIISSKNDKSSFCRKSIAIALVLAFVSGASLAIGLTVEGNNNRNGNNGISGSGTLFYNPFAAEPASSTTTKEGDEDQTLLELAERIIVACSETKLNQDRSECQHLCHSKMCCFELDDTEYSCRDDDGAKCAVHAGCEALFEGSLLEGAEEEEE